MEVEGAPVIYFADDAFGGARRASGVAQNEALDDFCHTSTTFVR